MVARQDASLGEMPVLRDLLVPYSRDARPRVRLPADRGVGEQPVFAPHRMADTSGARLEGAVNQHASEGLLGFRGGAWGNEKQDLPAAADSWWETEPGVCRMAHGVPNRVDRLRCLGNSIVPQVAEVIGRAIAAVAGAL
jgi:DNA (cytosine-5)-methyltransferase 1